ncbi:MAG TPA: TIGR03089 family protein [Aeromicrobium sp.]|nr:TIGR03089 family protein [Aeromicrobium sp.]
MTGTLATLLEPGPKPLITYYDAKTGERVELSSVTMANWVAKVANFLVDDLEVERGTRLRLALPSHWLRFVWLLGAWRVGVVVTDNDADIALTGPELQASEPIKLAASLRPLGARFVDEPVGFIDVGIAVPACGDIFVDLNPPEANDLALDVGGLTLTHHDLLSTEPSHDRRALAPASLTQDAQALVAALLGGGSLVIVADASEAEFARICSQEHATGS